MRGDPLARHDVGAALGEPGRRRAVLGDEGVEREELVVERLDAGRPCSVAPTLVAAAPVVELDHAQLGRVVEEIRVREGEFDRGRLVDHADLLAVRGVLGQEVPADREPPLRGQPTCDARPTVASGGPARRRRHRSRTDRR